MRFAILLPVLLLTGLMCSTLPLRAEDPPPTKGTVTGILTAKGETWIEVKGETDKEAIRYMPFWRGGAPKDGGGFDAATLQAIKKLVVPNLVKVDWEVQENRRRIVTVEAVALAEKSGTVTGVVTAKGETWIEVKPDKDGDKVFPTERYMPRWIGGMPKDGGGLDKDMLKTIAATQVGSRVTLKWISDERKRVTELTVTAPPPPANTAAK